jgi:hypothetical protein
VSLVSRLSAAFAALAGDVKTLRRQACCNAGGIITGTYYDNAYLGAGSATLAASASLLAAVPFSSPVAMTIDRFGIVVSTLAASGTADIHIYECLANGWPGNKLLSSSTLVTTSTGIKESTVSFTFEAGKTYWLAFRASVAVSVRGVPLTSAKQFGMITADGSGTLYATALVQTSNMSGAAPSAWGTVAFSQLSAVVPPSFRMRAV